MSLRKAAAAAERGGEAATSQVSALTIGLWDILIIGSPSVSLALWINNERITGAEGPYWVSAPSTRL